MRNGVKALFAFGMFLALAACNQDRLHEYGQQRPDVDSLHPDDRGLQSKDVLAASEQMARDVLADDAVRRSPVQWTVVADRIEDHTLDRRFNMVNYDIFLERLRTNLGVYGKGQVTLIENKAKLANLRSKELDLGGGGDEFKQTEGRGPAMPPRIQPNYILHGKVYDLPNRGTNYYLFEFTITNLKDGTISWTNKYEVKVAR